MTQKNKILPFERLLEAYILQDQDQYDSPISNSELKVVLSAPIEIPLPKEKIDQLINSLTQSLSRETLGSLITSSLTEHALDYELIQSKTGLTMSILDNIKNDMAYTNSIPVKSLVKLLKLLGLTVNKAKSAIEQTFDKLSTENKLFLSVPFNVQPSFRKGMKRNDFSDNSSLIKTDESYLYQNKEALDKYINRLVELYDEL